MSQLCLQTRFPRNSPIRTELTFWLRHQWLYLWQTQNYQPMHILFVLVYTLKTGRHQWLYLSQTQNYQKKNNCTSRSYVPWRRAWKLFSVLHNYQWNNYVMTICVITGVAQKASSIIWITILMQQVMNFTLFTVFTQSSLHFKNVKFTWNMFCFHINLLNMKQVYV